MKNGWMGKLLIGVCIIAFTLGIAGLAVKTIGSLASSFSSPKSSSAPSTQIAQLSESWVEESESNTEENTIPLEASGDSLSQQISEDNLEGSLFQESNTPVAATQQNTQTQAESQVQANSQMQTSTQERTNSQTQAAFQPVMQQGTTANEIIIVETAGNTDPWASSSTSPAENSAENNQPSTPEESTVIENEPTTGDSSTHESAISYELPFVPAH